jgi:acetyl esterase
VAINTLMRTVLKALSYPDLDIKKNYKLLRQMDLITHRNYLKPLSPYKTWDHRVTCGDHEVPVRIFSPGDRPEGYPLLIFFHGGGWVMGNIDSYDRVCTHMAQATQRLVVSVDYQLAPEHPFPHGLEDCYEVTREIFLDEALFGNVTDEIVLIGDSAGGNLAAAVSLMARDRGEFLPKKQILIYPATYNDHSPDSPFASIRENGTEYLLTAKRVSDYMELYCAQPADLQNPYFAPLLAKDLSRQPDTLILTAEYDPLRDEGEAYGRLLEEAGNRVEIHRMADALHGFLCLPPSFSHVQTTYAIIQSFLGEEPNGHE